MPKENRAQGRLGAALIRGVFSLEKINYGI